MNMRIIALAAITAPLITTAVSADADRAADMCAAYGQAAYNIVSGVSDAGG
jgi:hypothetical protein